MTENQFSLRVDIDLGLFVKVLFFRFQHLEIFSTFTVSLFTIELPNDPKLLHTNTVFENNYIVHDCKVNHVKKFDMKLYKLADLQLTI